MEAQSSASKSITSNILFFCTNNLSMFVEAAQIENAQNELLQKKIIVSIEYEVMLRKILE